MTDGASAIWKSAGRVTIVYESILVMAGAGFFGSNLTTTLKSAELSVHAGYNWWLR